MALRAGGGRRCAADGSLRVLFMHGLESGPGGSKARYLQDRFSQVHVPDMQMSAWDPRKANSPARWLLGFLLCAAAADWAVAGSGGVWLVALLLVVPLLRWRLRRSLAACGEIQRAAVAQFEPDVVLGSSWGGAVALRALETGDWAGPTVLLAPACCASGWPRVLWPCWQPTVARAVAERCLVLHGELDETCPCSEVVKLLGEAGCGMQVQVLPGGDHRLNRALLATNRLAEVLRQQVAAKAGS